MLKTFHPIWIVLVLLAGCSHPAAQPTVPGFLTNQSIRELPPWLLAEARHEEDGKLNNRLKPPGFALDPRKAAFIYGNLFHTVGEWSDFPNVRLFVTDECYLCIPASQETNGTLEGVLSIPACIRLRATDGMVFDETVSRWRPIGYLDEPRSVVRKRASGQRISDIIGAVGIPYCVQGYTSDLVLSWEMLLTPSGLMLDEQPVDTEVLIKKVATSFEAILEYWCQDGHLSLRLVKGKYCYASVENGQKGDGR